MKIALVGTGSRYKDAPFQDETWQIWTIPGLWDAGVRVDEVYEVHSLTNRLKYANIAADKMPRDKLKWMKKNVTVCHPTLCPTFPNARAIEFEKIMGVFGRYFTSSISWMMAEAILKEPEEIAIYGVTMSSRGEYAHQKPAMSYLIGWARAKGIKVTVSTESELMSAPYIYGYEDKPDFLTSIEDQKKRIKYMCDQAEADFAEAKERHDHANGYLECLKDFENNFYAVSRRV